MNKYNATTAIDSVDGKTGNIVGEYNDSFRTSKLSRSTLSKEYTGQAELK